MDTLVTEELQLTVDDVREVLDAQFKGDDGLYTDAAFVAKFVDESQRKFTVSYLASGEGQVRTAGYKPGAGDEVKPGAWGTSADNRKVPADGSTITGAEAQASEGYQCDGWFLRTTGDDGVTDTAVTQAAVLSREDVAGLFTTEGEGCKLTGDVTFVAKFSPKTEARFAVTYGTDGNGEVRTLGTVEDGEEVGFGEWGASASNTDIVALITAGVTGVQARS